MLNKTILVIDDEHQLRRLIVRILELEGYNVLEADSAKSAWKILQHQAVFVILCDVRLPDISGVDMVLQIKKQYPHCEIILLTAYGNIADGVQAIKNGAFHYLVKGDDNDKIIPWVEKAFRKTAPYSAVLQHDFTQIIGNSPLLLQAIEAARKVAKTDATVLLIGETGTGKEVFAQAIHQASSRSKQSFLALNCSAFPKDMLESELFGYRAGAFTGATKDKKGLIEEADKGTLFLDEIGELHPDLQAKLLRVLETQAFFKIGDTKPTQVNIRILAATNRALLEYAQQGHFRLDLYYRLSVFEIQLPALRQRLSDIPALADALLGTLCTKMNCSIPSLSSDFLALLQKHTWQGNIRELKNTLERALILAEGNELQPALLPTSMLELHSEQTHELNLDSIQKLHITKVLNYTQGNKAEAARLLQIGLTTLYRKIEEYKI